MLNTERPLWAARMKHMNCATEERRVLLTGELHASELQRGEAGGSRQAVRQATAGYYPASPSPPPARSWPAAVDRGLNQQEVDYQRH